MPGRSRVGAPAQSIFHKRIAFDMSLVINRKGTNITISDIGGGLGLFSLAFARLGARSILYDDFRSGRLHWPHRGRLKWPHFASVVVGVDVA